MPTMRPVILALAIAGVVSDATVPRQIHMADLLIAGANQSLFYNITRRLVNKLKGTHSDVNIRCLLYVQGYREKNEIKTSKRVNQNVDQILEALKDPHKSSRVFWAQSVGMLGLQAFEDYEEVCNKDSNTGSCTNDWVKIVVVIPNSVSFKGFYSELSRRTNGISKTFTFVIDGVNGGGTKPEGQVITSQKDVEKGINEIVKVMTYRTDMCELDIVKYDCKWYNEECRKNIHEWYLRTPTIIQSNYSLQCPKKNTPIEKFQQTTSYAPYALCPFKECKPESDVYSTCSSKLGNVAKVIGDIKGICSSPVVVFVCSKYVENELKLTDKMNLSQSFEGYCKRNYPTSSTPPTTTTEPKSTTYCPALPSTEEPQLEPGCHYVAFNDLGKTLEEKKSLICKSDHLKEVFGPQLLSKLGNKHDDINKVCASVKPPEPPESEECIEDACARVIGDLKDEKRLKELCTDEPLKELCAESLPSLLGKGGRDMDIKVTCKLLKAKGNKQCKSCWQRIVAILTPVFIVFIIIYALTIITPYFYLRYKGLLGTGSDDRPRHRRGRRRTRSGPPQVSRTELRNIVAEATAIPPEPQPMILVGNPLFPIPPPGGDLVGQGARSKSERAKNCKSRQVSIKLPVDAKPTESGRLAQLNMAIDDLLGTQPNGKHQGGSLRSKPSNPKIKSSRDLVEPDAMGRGSKESNENEKASIQLKLVRKALESVASVKPNLKISPRKSDPTDSNGSRD